MVRKSKSIHYGKGQYRPAPNGRGFDCRITIKGKRIYSRQPDERAARVWLDAADSDTPLACPLTRAQMLDAQEAIAKLPPDITLSKLADIYLERESIEPITTENAVERFLDSRERRVTAVTLSGYRCILRTLAKSCPEMLADITPRHIEDAISRFSKVRHNTMLSHAKVFFGYALNEGWLSVSPAARLKRLRSPEPPKSVFSVEQAQALLLCAERMKPKLVPYLALGLFAGIRPGELQRMTSASIKAKFIILDGKDTKTADARTIRIRPNLAQWLKSYPFDGSVAYLSPRRILREVSTVREAAGIPVWNKDVMRHSFATYAYELEKDAALIASEMGHHGTDIFFRHYRALAHPDEGKKFFSITPKLGTNRERFAKT